MTFLSDLLDAHIPDPPRDRRTASRGVGHLLRRPVVGRRGDLSTVTEFDRFRRALGAAVTPSAGSTVGPLQRRTASPPARRITSRVASRGHGGTGSPT